MVNKGMDKKDIYMKTFMFRSDEGRINYLENVLRKENLLDKKTKESVYETLGDLFYKKEEDSKAASYYSKISRYGDNPWDKIADNYHKEGNLKKTVEAYEKGKSKRGKEFIRGLTEKDITYILDQGLKPYDVKNTRTRLYDLEEFSRKDLNERTKKFVYKSIGDLYYYGYYNVFSGETTCKNIEKATEAYKKADLADKTEKEITKPDNLNYYSDDDIAMERIYEGFAIDE